MRKTCKQRSIPENIRHFPDTTWTTGIHWEAENSATVLYRKANHKPFQFENLPERQNVGSATLLHRWCCCRSTSGRVARSACSVCSPGLAVPLPGIDQSSQRAEIAASLLAMQISSGDLLIYSDCQNVVKGLNPRTAAK